MAEKAVRKTTTKRAVRRTTTKTVSAKTTVQKTVAPSARKAPTRVASSTSTRGKKSPKVLFIGLFLFLVLLGISAAIGFSDKGQLDVENTIALRKQNASPEEQESLKAVPEQQAQNNVPNGGLVGMGQDQTPPPLPVVTQTSTTSSSTPQTASSTESVVESEAAQDAQSEVVTEPPVETPPAQTPVQ